MKKRGLEIRFCDDLKPHKKYYYAMKDNSDSVIIIVDDDMLYPENMTKQLISTHKRYPNAVVCEYAHRIEFSKDGKIAGYWNWTSNYDKQTEHMYRICPVGCGGVLYPPNVLDKRLFDKEKLMICGLK